jgi:hypothetical protein
MIEHLWRGEGHRIVAYLGFDTNEAGKRKLHHRKFPTTAKALDFAKAKNGQGHDVWFACSLFDGDRRQQKFVGSVGGFWLDFDVKPDSDNDYGSRKEAIADIKRLVTDLRLPKPVVVDSGNGFHVYWLINERMEPDDWRTTAKNLKRMLDVKGFKVDPMRTADSASIMRIPGTLNLKDPSKPKEVRIVTDSKPVDLDTFKDCLPFIPTESDGPSISAKSNDATNANLTFSGRQAAEKCGQLKAIAESGGNVNEPLWYAAIGIAVHSTEGEELAHEWSQGHPDYTQAETSQKFYQRTNQDMGPTTCAHFQYLNHKGCKDCPFASKVKTPLSLGRQARVTTTLEGDTDELVIFKKWQVTNAGVVKLSEEDEPKPVFTIPFMVTSVGASDEGEAVAFVEWRTPAGTRKKGELPLTAVGEPKEMRKWLLDKAIVQFYNEVRVMQYVKDFVQYLQTDKDPELTVRTFGWTPDNGFVIGTDKITPEGEQQEVRVSRKISADLRTALDARGELDDWIEGTELLSKPGYEMHQFAVLASLASPILHVANISGAVLSLAGQSGSGKSVITRYALSAWGDPKVLLAAPDSTVVARDVKMKLLKNIPLGIDDLSGEHLKSAHLKNVVYQAVNGRAKERGNQHGGLQEQATWNLIMFITTNNPLLEQNKFIVEAERRRMVELNVNDPMDPVDGEHLHNISAATHGVAGREVVKLIIKHRELVAERVRALSKKWLADPMIPEANRFGVWLCAVSMVVGKLCQRYGLIKFNPEPAVQRALQELKHINDIILSPSETMQDLVASFVNANISAISHSAHRKWTALDVNPHKVLARMDFDKQMLFIPAGNLRNWVGENNVSTSVLNEWVRVEDIARNKQVLMYMKGTKEKCYCVPWDVPDISELDIEGV